MMKIVSLFMTAMLLVFAMAFNAFALNVDVNEDNYSDAKDAVHSNASSESSIPTQPMPLQREEGEIVVVLNGNQVIFDVKPTIKSGTTLVPLRAVFEALGATVEWDQNTKMVTAVKGNTVIKLYVDSQTMYADGQSITLNHSAVIIEGRTLVPIRAISEAFGCLVGWDAKTKQVSVISDTLGYCMLYTPDGRAKSFHSSLASDQLNVGWYEYPVQTLYAPGKSKVFKKSEVAAQLKVVGMNTLCRYFMHKAKARYSKNQRLPHN